MRIIFLLVFLCYFSLHASDEREGIWVGTFGKKQVHANYSLWSEVQLRYNSEINSMAQTLFRGGVLYEFNAHHEFGLILGYIQTQLQKEYRPTLQHIYQGISVHNTSLILRSRLEFRDIEDNNDDSIRYRMMIRTVTPIKNNYDFVVWNEPFFNLTREDWTGNRTFERNRFFTGFRKKFETVALEVGYMNQFVPRVQDISEHLLVVYLNY